MTLALQAMPGLRVLGGAKDGREALDMVERLQPQVVLMDLVMPLLDGVEATRRIRRHCRDTRVLVLTGVAGSDRVLEALRAGASGMVPKTADLGELERAIRAVAAGDLYVSPEMAGPLLGHLATNDGPLDNAPGLALSTREREVVQLIGEGQSTREIAAGLVISPKTVAQHKANIIRKLGLKGTRELQVFAARRLVMRETVGV